MTSESHRQRNRNAPQVPLLTLLFAAACTLGACSQSPSSDEHANAAATSAAAAAKNGGTALKDAGAAVVEGAKAADAAARPAVEHAAHEAAPAIRTAASSAAHGIASAGTAIAGAVASDARGNAISGRAIFNQNCESCHGAAGRGGSIGPKLVEERNRKNFDQTVAWIKNPKAPMPKLYPSPLNASEVNDVAAYVQSL
jgi:mono/diheme cytochrome c family protein